MAGPSPHRGAALIVVMLILMVVTVLGVGGAQIALQSERTARYDRDYLIASQAAEAALVDAQLDIGDPDLSRAATGTRSGDFHQGDDGLFAKGCSATGNRLGLCAAAEAEDKPVWAEVDFLEEDENARTVRFGQFTGRTFDAGGGIRPVRPPRYIIEQIKDQVIGGSASDSAGQTRKLTMYRITAMGFGPRLDVQVVLQMVYRKDGA